MNFLQYLGIPYAALLSVIFGLFLVSFPMGVFVVFESEIGGDINHEFPITHLELFEGTEIYQSPTDVTLGDAFAVLWIFYVVIFAIASLGPKDSFLKSLNPIISLGRFTGKSNYMVGITKWFSVLVLVSVIVTLVQDSFGVETVPPMDENELVQFFYVSLAPLVEEFGFRVILLGVPLFALYSSRSSAKYFFRCLWTPKSLDVHDSKKAIALITFVGILFGFAHIAFGDSWSEGKFAQASAGGIILGWVYLRYGFVASLLVHWATNYFVFSYANLIAQINSVSIEASFSHSLMSTLETMLVISGIISVAVLVAGRFLAEKKSELEV